MASSPATQRLLRTHFLTRLLDNDLISPNADRHEVLVLLAASLAVPGLVITVLILGQKYVIGIPTPGLTSIAALDDKFLYITASMLIMALMAAVQWDALALDERDTAILGPLPIRARDIGLAKLSALVMFVATFAAILNGAPSVLFPLLTVSHFHVDIISVIRMIAVHIVVTMAAGAFGFLAVLLLRELLRLVLGRALFRKVSGIVQAALVIAFGAVLLLLPGIASHVPARWLTYDNAYRTIPPAWFVGLYESGTDNITLTIRGLGLRIPRGLVVPERDARVLYDVLMPRFSELAQVAIVAFGATTMLGLGLFAWNNRRLPLPQLSRPHAPGGRRDGLLQMAARLLVPSPLSRAGFFFTLQTLARSAQHRISIATACAVAIAASILLTSGIRAVATPSAAPTRFLALQTVVIAIILAGVRQALAIPAELRANWMFSMAWNGHVGPFVAGVKRAVAVAIVLPLLILVFAFAAYVLGPLTALLHAIVGLLVSLVFLELLIRPDKPPLTCAVRPAGNLKALGPIYLMLLFVAAYNLALLERWAFISGGHFAGLVGGLLLTYAIARPSSAQRGRLLARIELDELPDSPTQRLGLSEPV